MSVIESVFTRALNGIPDRGLEQIVAHREAGGRFCLTGHFYRTANPATKETDPCG